MQVGKQRKDSDNKQQTQLSKKKKIYSKFQYKDKVFEIGDICRFYNEQQDLIGKILSIVSTDQNHPDFGKINVQWYYYKKDLKFKGLGISEKDQNQISEQEVFPTNHQDKVYVQSLNGKCKIVTLEEFEQNPTVTPDIFFSRAEYDHINKVLKPSFNDWPKICSCQKPQNPQQTYIQCDACQQWFHPECQDTTVDIDSFICMSCTSQK
ncbi:phd-finger family protein [Stylonychia lemnae]|uniref:Phd-finger family protein n=1 Tax=Stylonychia lemnae TaxID=5949 RepID=A0A078AI75_STYLE|nr:phd-finger family protein [Stylonychia lemnae]|eukprot:CDW81636.1 phd-finger family protein [Stylonychia lemnae]